MVFGRPSIDKDGEAAVRVVTLNDHHANHVRGYKSNILTTTKYTWINLVPKAIFEQFRRFSNFYFMLIAVVSFIPGISPSSPITNVLPLLVVVGFGLARDVYEDFVRRRADTKSNREPRLILARDKKDDHQSSSDVPGTVQVRTCHIAVGDIVRVTKGDIFPADLMLLWASDNTGTCYVSTANLDGESNLKRCLAPPAVKDVSSVDEVAALKGEVSCQAPDASLYKFEGTFALSGADPVPLDSSNLLLRGSVLRNTEEIYGLCVYAGFDTKVALNMRNPPSKFSLLERKLNWVVLAIFCFLAATIVLSAILATVFQVRGGEDRYYLGEEQTGRSASFTFVRSLGTFFILYGTYIPVSLFVTLEFVHIIQGFFMAWDERMRARGIPLGARSTNLNELLGSVHHVLSDKTGTLTENVMRYVACAVGGEVLDIRTDPDIMRKRAVEQKLEPARTMIRSLAVCHAVVPEIVSGKDSSKATGEYQGQSPDEVALVTSAREFGVELVERSLDSITLNEFGETKEYKTLAELEFNSDRKRMSVIAEEPDGTIRLYCKGADSIMYPLMRPESVPVTLQGDVDRFAVEGLRTLIFANKKLTKEQYDTWFQKFQAARNSLENREQLVADVSAEIEVDLDYVCCTAVEDKLQHDVPDTIAFLRKAGVRLWVLTGDKRETAENIGYSSKLLDRSMEVIHVQADSTESLRKSIDSACERFKIEVHHPTKSGIVRRASRSLKESLGMLANEEPMPGEARDFAVIIDGPSLAFAIEQLPEEFMSMTDYCKTVICCRVSPLQKAQVVRLVKERRQATTLAIGDGGNDVSMIQEADIGVGIHGKEGSQAVRAADYTTAEFRFLKRLMVVHGRYADVRSAGLINLSFYKNFVFTLQQFYFQFFDAFTGTTIHNEWYVTFYNLAITLLPPFAYALFEKDLRETTLEEFPESYAFNRDRLHFGFRSIMEFGLGYGVYHSLAVFFLTRWGLGTSQIFSNGQDGGFQLFSVALTSMVVFVVLIKFIIASRSVSWVMLASVVFGYLVLFLVPLVTSRTVSPELLGVQSMVYGNGRFWAVGLHIVVSAYVLDFAVLLVRKYYSKNITLELKEYEDQTYRVGCCTG